MTTVEKIRDEMAANAKHPYIQVIGDFLLQYIDDHPEASEKILTKDRTIKGSLNAMQSEARKKQVDGCAVLTDAEGFGIVLNLPGLEGRTA